MKNTLMARIAQLATAIAQAAANLDFMRGQKMESEAILAHLMNDEKVIAPVVEAIVPSATPVIAAVEAVANVVESATNPPASPPAS